jgi:hypothetical protein
MKKMYIYYKIVICLHKNCPDFCLEFARETSKGNARRLSEILEDS